MKKEWFFDRFCGEQLVVCAEDGKIAEFFVENEKQGDPVGNVYKGRVTNVVAGMQAAFVACGLERNCYLPLNETAPELSAAYDGSASSAPVCLKEGDEILVQVVKPPRGNKGAKVTTALSFVGKTLIYLPRTAASSVAPVRRLYAGNEAGAREAHKRCVHECKLAYKEQGKR